MVSHQQVMDQRVACGVDRVCLVEVQGSTEEIIIYDHELHSYGVRTWVSLVEPIPRRGAYKYRYGYRRALLRSGQHPVDSSSQVW